MASRFLSRVRHLAILAATLALAACSSVAPLSPPSRPSPQAGERNMALRFAAVAGAEPVHCGKTIQGLGRTAASAELRDLRFYVSEIAFIDASGNAVPLRLSRGEWQDGQVALIDLADGRGNCVPSASQTNDVVTGALPRGDYRGLRFTVGVPHALNHSDYASAMPPLDVQAMAWAWQVGRKFMQVEISPTGGVARAASGSAPGRAFLFHLGTTGCRGNPVTGETVHCERSNRAEVVLDRFDPDNDLVALDLAALYRDSDIQRDGGGALGCMSAVSDPECGPLFQALGIDMASGRPLPPKDRPAGAFKRLPR